MEPAYVGLGGNVGDDVALRLRWAAEQMGALPGIGRVRLSSLWRTAPYGPVTDQPWFVNAAAELEVTGPLAPGALLAQLLEIEARAGRDRDIERWMGPRPLDLDLLLWGARVICDIGPPRLDLPHPRLGLRAFALAPLVELAGHDLVIPGAGRAGDLLAQALSSQPVYKIV